MKPLPVKTDSVRVLLACARPIASRFLKLDIKLKEKKDHVDALIHLLHENRLTITDIKDKGRRIEFHISPPFPHLSYLIPRIEALEGVEEIAHEFDGHAVEVHRISDELDAIRKGLGGVKKFVELKVLPHATREDLYDHLESNPRYDVLHFVGHGNALGSILLEDENSPGWARHVGSSDLAELVAGKVSIFINSACHGERSIAALLDAPKNERPVAMIFCQGEHPIPTRALLLFAERFYSTLLNGGSSEDAFRNGNEKIRRDDVIGEVACPDGLGKDCRPSPFRLLKLDQARPVSFPLIQEGGLDVSKLNAPPTPHRKITRETREILGREVAIARLMEDLLPPRGGLKEQKSLLVNLHGEGGIGKTRLAQGVCDTLAEYCRFGGGIYEVNCEKEQDTVRLALAALKSLGIEAAEKVPNPISALPLVLKDISEKSGDVLLFLDNLDPLFSPGSDLLDPHPASLIKAIFTECDRVGILTTCRSKLEIGAFETDFIVDPLEQDVSFYLFVLFVSDADLKKQLSSLGKEGASSLIKLVSALDGHPLSIFLAAQRLQSGLDPVEKQLAEAHRKLTSLLKSPRLKAVPERQKSLQASLDLSYALLPDKAKDIFRKSSFFPGGLYRDVSTLDPLLGKDWRDAVEAAYNIGLYRFDSEDQRFRMLNPIREYAADKLEEQERDVFYRSAVQHWAGFTLLQDFLLNPVQNLEIMKQLNLPENPNELHKRLAELHTAGFSALMAEEANILYAFQWAVEQDFDSAEKIATGLMDFLKLTDKRQTNVWIAEKTVEKCTTQEMKAKWLNNLGNRLSALGEREPARKATEEAVTIRRKLAEKHPDAFLPDLAMSLNNLGNRLSELGEREEILKQVASCDGLVQTLIEKTRNPPYIVHFYRRISSFLCKCGEKEEALKYLDRAIRILEPLAKNQPMALKELLSVNETRLEIMKELKHPDAERLAETIRKEKEDLPQD